MIKQFSLCVVVWITILGLARSAPVTYSSIGPSRDLGYFTDGYNHYRICRETTAHFSCGTNLYLYFGACWYASPEGDIPGVSACWAWTPADVGYCNTPLWKCDTYIKKQCDGKKSCSVTVTHDNMGGDPCPNKAKYLGLALRCDVLMVTSWDEPIPWSPAKLEFAGFIDNDEGEYNYNYGAENNGYIVQVSSSTVYVVVFIICLVLLVNIAFLCHHNCRAPKSKTRKYRKVSQFASSDDDMQNLKECKN